MAGLAQPRFIDPGSLTIGGVGRRYTPATLAEIPNQWVETQALVSSSTGRIGGEAYGVWYDLLKGGGAFTYLSGVRFGEFAPIHNGFTRAIVGSLHYAAFTHQGPHTELRRTIDAILTQWLPSSGREVATGADQPDFIERYSEEFNQTGAGPIEIWLPIKKK